MSGDDALTRLLILIPTLEIGGAERQMTLLLKGLDRSQYSLALVCCRLKGPLVEEVPPHVRLFDLGKRSRWDFPLLVARLRRILEEFRPEFIIASMEYAAVLAWLSNRWRSRRACIIARKEVMPSRARLGESFRRAKRILDHIVDRRVNMIIAPSHGILRELASVPQHSGIPMVRIPNVVDLRRVRAQVENHPTAPVRRIVGLGRLVSGKRFDLAIKALAILPLGSAEFHLVGDGPERRSLERLASHLGVGQFTHFHGFHADPFPILERAAFGVMPSRFEGFGNVIIEMFAVGLPVVAFDVDYGPREIIRNGENGILVPDLNARDLAEAFTVLLGDSELRKRMGAQARLDAERCYGVDEAVRTYERCFAALRGKDATAFAAMG